jgi:hypothetical protein
MCPKASPITPSRQEEKLKGTRQFSQQNSVRFPLSWSFQQFHSQCPELKALACLVDRRNGFYSLGPVPEEGAALKVSVVPSGIV